MGGIATLGVLALIPSQVGSVFLGSLAGMKTGPVAAGLVGGLQVGLSDRLVVLVMTSPLITSLKVTDCLTYSSVVCPPTNSGWAWMRSYSHRHTNSRVLCLEHASLSVLAQV